MTTTRIYATPEEVRRAGFRALVTELGPTNATRFLLQYERGRDDYVQVRGGLFREQTVERIYDELAGRGTKPDTKPESK